MSWALRYAHFAEHRNLSLRSELFEIARPLSEQGRLDFERFKTGWDSGRFRKTVLDESRRGWRELKLDGAGAPVPYRPKIVEKEDGYHRIRIRYTNQERKQIPVLRTGTETGQAPNPIIRTLRNIITRYATAW